MATPNTKQKTPARPAKSRPAPAATEGEAVEGEVVTPRTKLEERRAQNADRGLAPRRPTDRRQKAGRKKPTALGTDEVEVEYDGFLYSVNPSVLDDWELLEAEADGVLEEMSLPEQYRQMLGEDGYEELKENVKEKHGYVSGRVMAGFMEAVQEQVAEGNS